MNFQADKMEISDFINRTFQKADLNDNSVVLDRFSIPMNEDFLDNRAAFIKNEIHSDSEFNYAFYKLDRKSVV